MDDASALALLLAGIYLVDCVVRVRTGGVAVRVRGEREGKAWRPATWTDVADGGLVLADPLPPLSPVLVCQPWTVALAPEGACARAGLAFSQSRSSGAPTRFVTWDAAVTARAEAAEVIVDDARFAVLASAPAAEALAQALREIAAAPAELRGGEIDGTIARRLDVEAVRARRAQWRRASARLRVSTQVLFAVCLVVVLGMAGVRWLEAYWTWTALALVPAVAWTVSDAAHAHRRLFPGNDAARRHLCWVAALAPLSAIRAGQAVARDTFACHDPVTVAAEFCGDEAFRRFARDTLCDLRHPRPAAVPEENPAAARVEAWFRERVTQHTERFLRAAGVDPAALLAPPAPGGPADRGYCPRCRAVYVRADGDCSDCGGVALVPLASAAG